MKWIYLSLLLFTTVATFAQDKVASKLLNAVSDQYNGYKTMEIEFDMTIDYPEHDNETFKGKIIQSGNKFIFLGGSQDIYCDESAVWFYLKSRNEVQINDYEYDPEDFTVITPRDLLKQYRSGKYDYQVIESDTKNMIVEFKPLDRDNEYAKFKTEINKKTKLIEKVFAYSKDGSVVSIIVNSQIPNKSYGAEVFKFNPDKYPGIHVEDLRID